MTTLLSRSSSRAISYTRIARVPSLRLNVYSLIPASDDDIERIEVIRGPGASLWGANAVNGVINIITKSSHDTRGTLVSMGGGTEDRLITGVRQGFSLGDYASLRIYASYAERDDFASLSEGGLDDDWETAHQGFRMDWDRSTRDFFTLQGDTYHGRIRQRTGTALRETHVQGGNLLGRWEHRFSEESVLTVQSYVDRTERHNTSFGEDLDTFDIDIQHRFSAGARHEIMWGLGYRSLRSETDDGVTLMFDPATRHDALLSAFLQDSIWIVPDRWRIAVGCKFEDNDYTGFEYQPTVRLLWTPSPVSTVWAAVSRALTMPNRHNSDVFLAVDIPGMGPFPVLVGNPDLDVERAVVYEAGYRTQVTPAFNLDLALFYTDQKDIAATDYDPMGTSSFENSRSVDAFGVEISATYSLTDWWRIHANYSFLDVESDSAPGSSAEERLEDQFAEVVDPEHQVQIRSAMNLGHNLEFDASLYYVDELPLSIDGSLPDVPSYTRVDVRLGWRPVEWAELSLVGQNILDRKHPETADNGTLVAGQAERAFFTKLVLMF